MRKLWPHRFIFESTSWNLVNLDPSSITRDFQLLQLLQKRKSQISTFNIVTNSCVFLLREKQPKIDHTNLFWDILFELLIELVMVEKRRPIWSQFAVATVSIIFACFCLLEATTVIVTSLLPVAIYNKTVSHLFESSLPVERFFHVKRLSLATPLINTFSWWINF